jgi:hypothetical protein
VILLPCHFAGVTKRKSFGDDGTAKIRRSKDEGSCNDLIARSEKDGEASTSAIKRSAKKQEARV